MCREAEARANAAEEAKIQLTLALARLDDELRATGTRFQVCFSPALVSSACEALSCCTTFNCVPLVCCSDFCFYVCFGL